MNHIAIFIDAENLTNWVRNDGVQSLMDELLPLGQIVVRKAYGKWSTSQLAPLQSALNENGFELVHTFHPVSGKNSTDIKMTVDTMEVALDSQVQWIVLATGDSDFSPLFRKLREQGKEVIGVGPKSPLSECVKNSCSRYIYTDDAAASQADDGDEDDGDRSSRLVAEKIDSMEMLRSVLQKEDGPLPLAAVKPKMIGLDNAFNEKRLGFKTFMEFVKSADFVQINDVGGGSYTVSLAEQKVSVEEDVQMILAKALKRKGWDIFPKNMLKKIYMAACDLTSFVPMSKQMLVEEIVAMNIPGTTSSYINRALGTFFKAKLVTVSMSDDGDKLWTLTETNQYWKEIDKAMLDRLNVSLKETNQKVGKKDVAAMLYGKYAEGEIEKLI